MMQLPEWGLGMLWVDRVDLYPFLDPDRVEHLMCLVGGESFAVQRVAADRLVVGAAEAYV
jgi:hypothetical protein